jgi:hypothetical protein
MSETGQGRQLSEPQRGDDTERDDNANRQG